jgi:23S rRNA (guanosine2251-2'-O)-methyltransferase
VARPSDPIPPDEILIGRRPVLESLRAGNSARRIYLAEGIARSGIVEEIRRRSDQAGVPVTVVPRTQIDKLSGGGNHQGVVAHTTRFRYTPLEDLLRADAPMLLFLDGVTDPHNVGALTRALEEAKSAGLWIVGLDENAEDDLWSSSLAEPPAGLVLGAEGSGLSQNVRAHCDGLLRIPMQGPLQSLNVSVAGGIAMFEIARRGAWSGTLLPARSTTEATSGEGSRNRA